MYILDHPIRPSLERIEEYINSNECSLNLSLLNASNNYIFIYTNVDISKENNIMINLTAMEFFQFNE